MYIESKEVYYSKIREELKTKIKSYGCFSFGIHNIDKSHVEPIIDELAKEGYEVEILKYYSGYFECKIKGRKTIFDEFRDMLNELKTDNSKYTVERTERKLYSFLTGGSERYCYGGSGYVKEFITECSEIVGFEEDD